MTTILGLGTMVFADFGKFRYGGPTIALSLAVALLACLTLAPALLRAGGWIVFWPFGIGTVHDPDERHATTVLGRLWQAIGRAVVTRPGLIFAGCLLLLAWPAYESFSTPITYDLVAELSPQRPSVQGTELFCRYYPRGATGPITVLAQRSDAVFQTREGKNQISLLTRQLDGLQYVDSHGDLQRKPISSVRSLTNALGGRPVSTVKTITLSSLAEVRAAYVSHAPDYADRVTCLDLVTQYDPFSRENVRLLGVIEERLRDLSADPASPWHGTVFDLVGTTAGIRDLEAVNQSDCRRIGVLTSIAVLGVLIVVLRRPLVSLYLVLTVLLGFFVTMGVTKLVFMQLYGESFHGLDWKLPLFLFVILVAVGEDYNIYLATRVIEEQRRRGALEGLRVAVVRTGGIITSCGVIMAGTFASMMTGTLRGMHELGFALAFGVLLDTFVIRTILVPAFLAFSARWFATSPLPPGEG